MQLDQLKSSTKNGPGITLRLSLNMIGTSETNFPHKLWLTDIQIKKYL